MSKTNLKWHFLDDLTESGNRIKCLFTVYRETINKKGMPYSNIYVTLWNKEERVYSLCYFKRKGFNKYDATRSFHKTAEIALFEITQSIIDEVEEVTSIDYKEALEKYYKWLKYERDRVDGLHR